jgi:hypothetical protein
VTRTLLEPISDSVYRAFLSLKASNGNDAKVGETDDESSSIR